MDPTGHDGVTVSVAESEYAPCACSPLGKLWRTARPHAPGAAPQWTTYSYDGSGRTLTVMLPDGSVTRYDYTGNTTKITDPAGKWKKQTTDAFGNLTTVTEPNPAGGADWTTTYTYNVLGKLLAVSMPRPYGNGTYTQTRTFTYPVTNTYFNGNAVTIPSARLISETNPETGTVTYQYDASNRLASKTDARGRQTQYTYDALGRVTQTRFYRNGNQLDHIDYHYDTNPLDDQFTQNGAGRLASVEFWGRNNLAWTPGADEHIVPIQYHYSYNQAGRVTNQRMKVFAATPRQIVADAAYGWDNEGRMTSLQEPDNGPLDTYTYDAMGRLASGGATYGPAGELLTFNGVNRTYNVLGQLTRMAKSGVMDIEYRYTTGQNNGRIAEAVDYVTGEDVLYTYDPLNRLATAQTTSSAWGNAYTYDGWGNLTSKSVLKGTAPAMSQTYDPSLNMPTGATPPTVDADGFDSERRATAGQGEFTPFAGAISYDPNGRKVFWGWWNWYGPEMSCEVYFHSITGQRLARYKCGNNVWDDEQGVQHVDCYSALQDRTQHIGGQLTTWNGGAATTDRLGSVRARDNDRYTYYPYGEVHTSNGSNPQYAGLESPLRKYDPNLGRFDRPDPLGMSAVVMGDPGSWNRFAYAGGDPVNFNDPKGLATCKVVSVVTTYPDPDNAMNPVSSAEVQCVSDGETYWGTEWVSFNGNIADTVAEAEQGFGAALDYQESNAGSWIYDSLSSACTTGTFGGIWGLNCPGGLLLAPNPTTTTVSQLIRSLAALLGNALGAVVMGLANPQQLGSNEERCWEQYMAEVAICKRLGDASCYSQAMERYAACVKGKPLPPFPYKAPAQPGPPRRRNIGIGN